MAESGMRNAECGMRKEKVSKTKQGENKSLNKFEVRIFRAC